jgi:hypothetical protein
MTTVEAYTSAHLGLHYDDNGNVIDADYFCSDYCHQDFARTNGWPYEGWNGCNEIQAPQWCANCGDEI